MSNHTNAVLTAKDFRTLENLLTSDVSLEWRVRRAVRDKLRHAEVVFGADIPYDVITLGTRFRFQIDGLIPDERVLVRLCDSYPQGTAMCLSTVRGIALLGQKEGDVINLPAGGRTEQIIVETVLFQPEANVHHVHLLNAEEARVHSRTADIIDLINRPVGAPYWDGDDPGPHAA